MIFRDRHSFFKIKREAKLRISRHSADLAEASDTMNNTHFPSVSFVDMFAGKI